MFAASSTAKFGPKVFLASISRSLGNEDSESGRDDIASGLTGSTAIGDVLNQVSRLLISTAREGIIVYDLDLKYLLWNPFMEQMTGLGSSEVLGKHHSDLFPFVKEKGLDRLIARALKGESVTTPEFSFYVPGSGKTGWASADYGPLRDWKGAIVGVLATIEDITRRKVAEEALAHSEQRYRSIVEEGAVEALRLSEANKVELEKQRLHSQKMEAVGRLAGGVAHDFNNLLTAILGYAQLLQGRLGADHPLGSEVDEILDAGHRAAALTSQLLAFSRRQTLNASNINLNDTIGNLMKMLRRIIGEDVELGFQPSPDLNDVFADPGQIEQVIMNLAVNARDAMPGGGRLRIETGNVTLDDAFCREHLWAQPGDYVRISVSDSGAGMDPEIQRRIFEPFFTIKEVGKGTGLGLSVVYGIVKQHDGLIQIYSEPDHGTTFNLYLKARMAAVREVPPALQGPPRGGTETILVAEDEETLRELARTVLGSLGYNVILASNGEEAVLAYEIAKNEIDLVILDLIMPRMGGREAWERIRALGARFPVIFMTGYIPDMLMDKLSVESAALLVQKPYAVYELGRRVREVLDARATGKS
jgi:PAS domain S-box-containing protein